MNQAVPKGIPATSLSDLDILVQRLEGETAWDTGKRLKRNDWINILWGIKASSPAAYDQLKKDAVDKQRRWEEFLASR